MQQNSEPACTRRESKATDGDLDGGYVGSAEQLEPAEACALDDVAQPSGHWFILRWSGSRCRWGSG